MAYHFIGLGGIGMSALARILLQKNHKVTGSDARSSALLQELTKEGAVVHIGHSAEHLEGSKQVIYSSSIQKDNVEWMKAKAQNLPILHRSDLLHELMQGKKGLLVSGTHGKTTTTALLAIVLLEAGLDPSFVVGGLIRSLHTNGRSGEGEYFVAEADESDGSFLKTPSFAAILTNLEDEHLDHWGSSAALDRAFQQFIDQTEHLFWCCDDPRLAQLKTKGVSYGFSLGADLRLTRLKHTRKGILFDLNDYHEIELSLFGKHNALNAAAVFGLALHLGIKEEIIRKAFREFAGTARRLEFKGEKHKVCLYDDYGHHPTEIRAAIQGLRQRSLERRLVVVFQPHRFTRVRDCFEEWPFALQEADLVVMTDIYSAGEVPIAEVTSASLYAKLREHLGAKVHFFPRTHLESGVAHLLQPLDVVLTMGAGDVTYAGEPILNLFQARAPKFTVAVLAGGISEEHPVSMMSARNIANAFDFSVYCVKRFGITKEGLWHREWDVETPKERISPELLAELMQCDVILPALHGTHGEDGMIAGFLETLQIPYVGCDYRAGSICMHKGWTKQVVLQHHVPIVPFFAWDRQSHALAPEVLIQKIEERFSYPVWIKPVHLGSSIGVHRAMNAEEAMRFANRGFELDDVILVEKEIIGRQIEFAVMGNETLQVALPGEIVSHGEFVAYDKKYGKAAMEIRVPAEISETEKEIGYELAAKVYQACGCKGLARVDFFLDESGLYWFNEVNPFPGCTDTSAFPKMWQVSGRPMSEVVDELVALALHRSREK